MQAPREWTEGEPDQSVFDRANARFIANAPTDITHLLATVEKLKAALDRYSSQTLTILEGRCRLNYDGDEGTTGPKLYFDEGETWDLGSYARQALREIEGEE